MKYILISPLMMAALFFSCSKSDMTSKGTTSCTLSGTYLNSTVLDQCPAKMPVDVPYYALELSFASNDSVDISNGVEKYKLPYSKTEEKCTFKIDSATQFGAMYFTALGDSTIQLYDSAWTKVNNFSSL